MLKGPQRFQRREFEAFHGAREKNLASPEPFQARSHRFFGLFLLLSMILHGMLLAGDARWFHKQPLQVIDLDLVSIVEPRKPLEPASSLAMPDVKPQPREKPKPPETKQEPVPEPKPLQPVEVPEKVKKPKPKPVQEKKVSVPQETPSSSVQEAAPSEMPSRTAAVGPPQGQSVPKAVGTEDPVKLFLGQVRQRIDRYKNYPYAARRRHVEGRVTVRFVIRPDGTIEGLELVKSSSSNLLDEAAVKAVRDAAPFPGFPRDVLNRPLAVEIGLVFELT
ncbi:MAG: energy transducer TonB [Desulfosoma sp.]